MHSFSVTIPFWNIFWFVVVVVVRSTRLGVRTPEYPRLQRMLSLKAENGLEQKEISVRDARHPTSKSTSCRRWARSQAGGACLAGQGRGRPLPKKQPEEARALRGEMAARELVGGVQALVPSYCKKGINL